MAEPNPQVAAQEGQAHLRVTRAGKRMGHVSELGEESVRLRESTSNAIVRRYLEPSHALSPLGPSRSIWSRTGADHKDPPVQGPPSPVVR